jgi:pilus assembly protein CpaB
MFFRNILLAVGAILVFAGIGLSLLWLTQMNAGPTPEAVRQPQPQLTVAPREAILEAAHPLPTGTLIRPSDFRWREIEPSEIRPGSILRKDSPDGEYLGAIVRKNFAEGEPLAAAELVKTTDRRFLSAVLKAGTRAVTIAVDGPQGSSGMVLPGDRVDVVLTQNLGGTAIDLSRKTVAETVLRNVRVIAVDQRLNLQASPVQETPPEKDFTPKEIRVPRTVTLELNQAQAEKLFVAAQLGGLQLPVRPLEGPAEAPAAEGTPAPTWASDVSPALAQLSHPQVQPAAVQPAVQPVATTTGSTIEAAIRKPPQAY